MNVIVLSGSTRFMQAYREWNVRLTLDGNVVLLVTLAPPSRPLAPDEQARVDAMRPTKVLLGNELFVLDVGRYIDEKTRRDIQVATACGRPVRYLSQVAPDWKETEETDPPT